MCRTESATSQARNARSCSRASRIPAEPGGNRLTTPAEMANGRPTQSACRRNSGENAGFSMGATCRAVAVEAVLVGKGHAVLGQSGGQVAHRVPRPEVTRENERDVVAAGTP